MPAFAQDKGAASEGGGEASRDIGEDFKLGRAKPITVPKIEDAQTRDLSTDAAKAAASMAIMTRSADGKTTTTPPGDALRAIIEKEYGAPAAKPEAGKTSGERAADPEFEATVRFSARMIASRSPTPRNIRSRRSAISKARPRTAVMAHARAR
jgi:hypothetical protein